MWIIFWNRHGKAVTEFLMNDETLINIETTLAHHDQQIQDLNDVIHRQWKEIEMLKAKLVHMLAKMKEVEAHAPSGSEGLSVTDLAAQEKPPHY